MKDLGLQKRTLETQKMKATIHKREVDPHDGVFQIEDFKKLCDFMGWQHDNSKIKRIEVLVIVEAK